MSPRFRRIDRDQQYLLPPDVRDWLPLGHPALFVVAMLGELDLSGFVAKSQTTFDRGRPAYHPEVMVGIALYASMSGIISSRRIERALAVDVGFRVVAANERQDHAQASPGSVEASSMRSGDARDTSEVRRRVP